MLRFDCWRSFHRLLFPALSLMAVSHLCPSANARDVSITPNIPFVDAQINGKTIRIERIQNPDSLLPKSFAKTSRKCPPFCIHPIRAANGVETVGELELIQFIKSHVEKGKGLLVDARLPAWYNKGTIPGAVNIPFTVLAPSKIGESDHLKDLLSSLGAKELSSGEWDFSNAQSLLMFCNGAWCDQSPRAIRSLLSAGYPREKLLYYRGGIQMWLLMGLTIGVPQQDYPWRNSMDLTSKSKR